MYNINNIIDKIGTQQIENFNVKSVGSILI